MHKQVFEYQAEAAMEYLLKGGKFADWLESKDFTQEEIAEINKIIEAMRPALAGKVLIRGIK